MLQYFTPCNLGWILLQQLNSDVRWNMFEPTSADYRSNADINTAPARQHRSHTVWFKVIGLSIWNYREFWFKHIHFTKVWLNWAQWWFVASRVITYGLCAENSINPVLNFIIKSWICLSGQKIVVTLPARPQSHGETYLSQPFLLWLCTHFSVFNLERNIVP